MLLLKRKAIDMVTGRPGLSPRNIKTFENEAGLRIFSVPDTTCHWLAMNQKKEPFDNVKVRQAINYAIPIPAIIPSVLHGYGTQMKSPIPAPDARLRRHDLALQARPREGQGPDERKPASPLPITLDLAVRVGWQPHEQAAVWIQRDLEQIGFKINIVRQTDATFRQLASKGDHAASIRPGNHGSTIRSSTWCRCSTRRRRAPTRRSTATRSSTSSSTRTCASRTPRSAWPPPRRPENRHRRRRLGHALVRQLDARDAQRYRRRREALGHLRALQRRSRQAEQAATTVGLFAFFLRRLRVIPTLFGVTLITFSSPMCCRAIRRS